MTFLLIFLVYAAGLFVALWRAGHRSQFSSSSGERRERPSRILIVGATGGTGRALVDLALERGYEITALVRNPSKVHRVDPRLTIVQGDILDEESVSAAMRGQEAVLSALGHKRFFYPTRILSKGTSNLLRSMERHGVSRIVCETSLGIGDSTGRLGLYYTLFVIPVIVPFYFWDKTRQERILAGSAADWVIVRPAALTNGARRGHLLHGARVGSYLWTRGISRKDVAEFMLDQLESDIYLRTAPGVSGQASDSARPVLVEDGPPK